MISPMDPSPEWAQTRITLRSKRGSAIPGMAIRICPASSMGTTCPTARLASSQKHGGKVTLTALRCNVISFLRGALYLRRMSVRLAFLTSLAILGPAHATTQDDVLSAALLPGWQTSSGSHMAAVDLSLAPGGKPIGAARATPGFRPASTGRDQGTWRQSASTGPPLPSFIPMGCSPSAIMIACSFRWR